MPHLELLERYGHRFKHLNFEFSSRTDGSKHVRDLARGYLLDYIFKHCPNLEALCLTDCPLQRCSPSMSKNHSITFLRVDLMHITTLAFFFYKLSIRMVALKEIYVSIRGTIRQPQLTFDVPYTNLDTMSLTLEGWRRITIGFRIMTENEVLFYKYYLREDKPELIESNIEEYDAIDACIRSDRDFARRFYLICCLRCKSIKELTLRFCDKKEPFPQPLTITIP